MEGVETLKLCSQSVRKEELFARRDIREDRTTEVWAYEFALTGSERLYSYACDGYAYSAGSAHTISIDRVNCAIFAIASSALKT